MRSCASDKNSERDDADSLVCLRVSRVVAVQNRFGVQSQRYRVVDQSKVDVAGLRHVREDHGDWSEDDENDQIT